jgi:hypothetical protein
MSNGTYPVPLPLVAPPIFASATLRQVSDIQQKLKEKNLPPKKNLKLSKIAAKPLIFGRLAVVACGGEMRSD